MPIDSQILRKSSFMRQNVEAKENRKARQNGKVDRHGNLESTNKTEHDIFIYKTKINHKTMNNAEPPKNQE